MSKLVEEFMSSLGGDVSEKISSQLGLDQGTVSNMIPQIAPLILGGLKKQMVEKGGASRVDHILNKYGDSGVLNNLGGLFSERAKDTNPDPNLGGLLGNAGGQAVSQLSKSMNIDSGTISKLIPMLAPAFLGFLTKKRDLDGLGSSGLSSLLDQDGDGNILDDVGGFLMKGLGGSASKGGSGLLGGMLGSFLGKKK